MTITTLQPDATAGIDTLIAENVPTRNFGVTVTLGCGDATAGVSRRILIRFDLSSITAGSTINSATLYMTCTAESATTNYDVGIHRGLVVFYEGVSDNAVPGAGEDASTWNLRNANGSVSWAGGVGGASGTEWAASATATTTITQAANTEFSWTVTADLTYWITNGNTNNGWWAINASEGTANCMKTFASSDNATSGYRPKLVVDWTAPSAGNPYYAYAQQ